MATEQSEAELLARALDNCEAETLARALKGDADAGQLALRLCYEGLTYGTLSRPLAEYLAARLWLIDEALKEAESLRGIKKSSGSIRSARDAAIAEALCIKKPAQKPRDPLPDWQVPYAAFGVLLLKANMRPEQVKGAMDEARQRIEGTNASLHRREAERILKAYLPMHNLDDEMLLHLLGPLREILPTYLPQTRRT